jgi:hypothetical protein
MSFRRQALPLSTIALVSAALVACSDATRAPSVSLTIHGSASAAPSAAIVRGSKSSAALADSVGDPASLSIGMYALYISTNEDCSAPVLVADYGTSAQYKDFVANPVLFTGSPASGAYKCLAIVMSDVLHFTSANTFGACVAGVEYFGDIYRDGETDWKDVDGIPIIGHGTDEAPVDDHVTIFLTQRPDAAMARGISEHQIVELTGDLIVPSSSTFYWNGEGSVSDAGGICGINPGRPEFR